MSPDAVRQEARERVVKLQRALEVLGETSGPEVEGLRSALEKATKLSSEPAVEVQITECKGFLARAEKRLAELDAQRVLEVASLEEGRARLQRLEAEAARKRVDVAKSLQVADDPDWQGSSKRQAVGVTTPVNLSGPRRRISSRCATKTS